jgi:hypothetical protein
MIQFSNSLLSSFRDAPKARTSDAQLRIGESMAPHDFAVAR